MVLVWGTSRYTAPLSYCGCADETGYFVFCFSLSLLSFFALLLQPLPIGLARRNHGHVEDVRSRGQADHVQHGRGDILRGDEALALLPPRHLLGDLFGFWSVKGHQKYC